MAIGHWSSDFLYYYTCRIKLSLISKERKNCLAILLQTVNSSMFAFSYSTPYYYCQLRFFSLHRIVRRNHTVKKKPRQKISIYYRYCDDRTMKIFERFYRLHWFYLELYLYISFVDVYHTVVFCLTMHHFFCPSFNNIKVEWDNWYQCR